jgi:transcriptional regulator with XRE-family HTH domain
VESSERLRVRFGKQVRAERVSNDLSQSKLANLLKDKGFSAAHPSTVAKIEAGDRPVTLDELAAYSAVFNVSVGKLLGLRARPRGDVLYVLRRLGRTVQMGRWQAMSVESELRDALEELVGTEFAGVAAEVEIAADALAAAAKALAAIGSDWAGGAVTRGTRAALRAWLDKGGEK